MHSVKESEKENKSRRERDREKARGREGKRERVRKEEFGKVENTESERENVKLNVAAEMSPTLLAHNLLTHKKKQSIQ